MNVGNGSDIFFDPVVCIAGVILSLVIIWVVTRKQD